MHIKSSMRTGKLCDEAIPNLTNIQYAPVICAARRCAAASSCDAGALFVACCCTSGETAAAAAEAAGGLPRAAADAPGATAAAGMTSSANWPPADGASLSSSRDEPQYCCCKAQHSRAQHCKISEEVQGSAGQTCWTKHASARYSQPSTDATVQRHMRQMPCRETAELA